MFSREFCEIFKNTFSHRTPPAASVGSTEIPVKVYQKMPGFLNSSWTYVFKTSCQNVFKTSCKSFFKASSRRFEDIFKTSCKDIFKTFSRRIIKLNCSEKFRRIHKKTSVPESLFLIKLNSVDLQLH